MKRNSFCKAIFGLFLLAGLAGSALPSAAQYYANAVQNHGGDPTVIYNPTDGYYYGSGTGFYTPVSGLPNGSTGTLTVFRSTGLADLFNSTDVVQVPVTEDAGAGGSVGTPGLLAYQGKIYMYYTASSRDGSGKITHVAVSPAADAMGTWTDRNDVVLPAYAWDPFYRASTGEIYCFYSTNHNIHAQKMIDPLTPDLNRPFQIISFATLDTTSPEYRAWEHRDNLNPPGANEGPQAFTLPVNGQPAIYMTYNANTYQSDVYAMGLMHYSNTDGTDHLDSPANWTKTTANDTPWFQTSTDDGHGNLVAGPGTSAIVADLNGKLWDVYTARFNSSNANNRELRMDPIGLDTSGAPLNPQPEPSREGALIPLPAGDPATTTWFVPAGAYQSSDPRVLYSDVGGGQRAPWTVLQGPTGPYMGTNALYAYYMIQFFGRSIAVNGPTGQGYGKASIYKDGTWVQDVDFSKSVSSGPIYIGNYSTAGEHSLLVLVNPLGTSGQTGNPVGLSQFQVSDNVNSSLGDVNGDGVVNCVDFDLVKASFGKSKSQPGYNPAADTNNDGAVNILDLSIVSRNVPAGTVCK